MMKTRRNALYPRPFPKAHCLAPRTNAFGLAFHWLLAIGAANLRSNRLPDDPSLPAAPQRRILSLATRNQKTGQLILGFKSHPFRHFYSFILILLEMTDLPALHHSQFLGKIKIIRRLRENHA